VAPLAPAGGSGGGLAARRALRRVARVLGPLLRLVNAVVLNARFTAAATALHPSVVHAHDLNTLRAGLAVASATGARLVYDAHELHSHRNDMGPLRRWWARREEQRALPRVDAFITTTDSWADYLAGLYRIPRPLVVRNVPERLAAEPGWDLRTELGIAADRRILLYQGSIQTNRGIEQAIDALALLPDCDLVVIGYGALRPVLEDRVRREGLGERVRFFGPIPNDELLHYTASADVGLCLIQASSLSYYWSLPNKLFEYTMAGVPVVASDYPEMGGFVRREGVGEVCDPESPRSIADAVCRVLDTVDDVRAAARSASQRYVWEVEEQVLRQTYADLLDGSAARGGDDRSPMAG
jgi:glycosyltransferase involved in cell wall biosynthesis